ncbi:hypothetical protein [Acinetobacter rathckeae]|uniref:hypothetical protein n=1 Tax=Acinetobacter rathckeae TaxID=2605272 RepID=UPI0018A315DB|nr:hypothetical protein [Acinetobacter rathckeae]MBF7696613.1 hypothetical protein [Acinetobacter rathckeae]
MIKQTQTKMFDFSDVGLDFCSGAKLLFPSIFKKILANGYNKQTVTSINISGNQVTLGFGVSHNYKADRVLKVIASGGYSQEVYIDSVTDQSLTFTDNNTSNLNGTVTSYIASLNWSLLYESDSVHLYKMKNLSEEDVYVRFVFQTTPNYMNTVGVCVGMSADITLGTITDTTSNTLHATAMTPQSGFQWLFYQGTSSSYNNSNYSQGFSNFGRGCVIGSLYHLCFLSNSHYWNYMGVFNAILPIATMYSDTLTSRVSVWGYRCNDVSSSSVGTPLAFAQAFIHNTEVCSRYQKDGSLFKIAYQLAPDSYVGNALDSFNTTTCMPLGITEASTGQHLGYVYGAYTAMYGATNALDLGKVSDNPMLTVDTDFKNNIALLATATNSYSAYSAYVCVPVEEIKYA